MEKLSSAEHRQLKGKEHEEPQFSNKLALICSCLGCVVGTGNIWRFPRIVASNSEDEGGLVFLLVWILFLFLWSIPMLLIEYGTGKYTKKAIIGSFMELAGKKSAWCGAFISMVTFAISCYYSVVLGWCFYYVGYFLANSLPADDLESREIFRSFAEDSSWPLLFHSIALLLAGMSVIKGVKTFEKVNMVLVPLLLLIILFTLIWSLTQDYADYGITFLFTPKWDALSKPRLWVDAVSQNAFDTGAGMGIMIPYASFMGKERAIVKYGVMIPSTNNFVSLCCGILIFATVFSTRIKSVPGITQASIVNTMKEAGPASTGLTFIWIPVLFSSLGTFGHVLCVLFFICLSFAGITSLISNIELMTHTFVDFGLPRKIGMPLTTLLTFLVGMPSALNINVLTNQDFVWGFALVLNGFFLQYLVIQFGTRAFRLRAYNYSGSSDDWTLPRLWEWVVKYIAPVEGIALIAWWAIDLISSEADDGEKWYEVGKETFMMTIIQWVSLCVLVVFVNIVYYKCRVSGSDESVGLLTESDQQLYSDYTPKHNKIVTSQRTPDGQVSQDVRL